MKKRLIKMFFAFTLLFGFSFTLASCNKTDNETPEQVIPEDDKKDDTPVTPVTPETPVTPVTPVNPETPSDSEPEGPVTLTALPEGYFANLVQLPNRVSVSFKDCQLNYKDKVFKVYNESYLNVAYVDETLKANGYLKLSLVNAPAERFARLYFSLDDEFILRSVNDLELDLNFVPKDNYSEIYYDDEFHDEEVIYKEIKLSKSDAFAKINDIAEQLGYDNFDINSIDSIEDVASLMNISNDKVSTVKTEAIGMLSVISNFLFNTSFGPNEITLSLKFDAIKLVNNMASEITIEDIFDMLVGEGSFAAIVNLLSKTYSEVNQEDITAPVPGKQYFTYDADEEEYVPVSVTAWEENTTYYIDNKDLGQYTLDDLLITNKDDKTGLITADSIDAGINKLFDLIGKIVPMIMNMGFGEDVGESMPITSSFDQSMIVKSLYMLLAQSGYNIEPQYMFEQVTGLTEWKKDAYYFENIYKVVDQEEITAPVSEKQYFTYNAETKEYVAVKNLTAWEENTTYYELDFNNPVETTQLKTPDANTTYYVVEDDVWRYNDEDESDLFRFVTEWETGKEYYKLDFEAVTGLEEFDSETTYYDEEKYPINTTSAEGEDYVAAPDPSTTYYIEKYVIVDTEVETEPDLTSYYFVKVAEGEYDYILTHFDLDDTYFIKEADGYTMVEDNTVRPDSTKIYVKGYKSYGLVPCENLVEFDENTDYYDENGIGIEIYEPSIPDSEKTYYTQISSIAKFLSIESLQTISVNDAASMIFRFISASKLDKDDFENDEKYSEAINEIMSLEINIVDYTQPIVELVKDKKVYDLVALVINSKLDPQFVEAVIESEFEEDVEYYEYNESIDSYVSTSDTTPVAGKEYYVQKNFTADDVKNAINAFADKLNESISFKIITDNDAKLNKISLSVDTSIIKGEIVADFTKEYSDTIKEELAAYKVYAEERDDKSSRILEEILNDNIFDGYERDGYTYSIIKENGENVGIKETNTTLDKEVEYYFDDEKTDTTPLKSLKKYYADNYLYYVATLQTNVDQDNDGKNDYITLRFVYDLTTNKFVVENLYDFYVFDYELNDYKAVTEDEFENTNAPESGEAGKPFIKKRVNKLTNSQKLYITYYKAVEA